MKERTNDGRMDDVIRDEGIKDKADDRRMDDAMGYGGIKDVSDMVEHTSMILTYEKKI